jgi:DNA-binding transcriptional LysR family regulator
MKRFDVSTLSLLIAVAENGSLSKTSQKLHLAVGAMSKRVADLEALVGAKLFFRHSRGLTLTAAGHSMVQNARDILFAVDRMHADISQFSRGLKGRVRIGANTSAVTQYLPEELSAFARRFPAIDIDLEELVSDDIVKKVTDGRADVGIFSKTVSHGQLETFPYRNEQLCLVAPPRHPAARRQRMLLEDALDSDFIALEQGSSLLNLLSAQAGSRLKISVQVRSFDAMCRMVQTGLGVGVLPQQAALVHAKSMAIKVVPLGNDWARRELVLGIRSLQALTAAARSMVDHLIAKARLTASSIGER